MARKNRATSISLSEKEIELLLEVAERLDCTWGGKPSLTELNRKIAHGEISIGRSSIDEVTPEHVDLVLNLVGTFIKSVLTSRKESNTL